MKKAICSVIPYLFIAAMITLDRVTKAWASSALAAHGTLPVIKDVFHLTYAENTGAAFSMFSNGRWILVAVTVAALVLIIVALFKKRLPKALARWAAYCVISGAVGNLIDRVFYGYVVDMLEVRFVKFAIFNVADTLICIGGGLFAIYIIREWIHERKTVAGKND